MFQNNNNLEQTFRDWVKGAKYEELVKAYNNSCLDKKKIIQQELNIRFYSDSKSSNQIDYKQEYEEVYKVLVHYCESLNYSKKEIEKSIPIELVYMIYKKTDEYKQAQEKIDNYILESNQQLFNFCFDGPYCPKISTESLERRINRKLP